MSDITLEQVVNLFNNLSDRIEEKHLSTHRRFDGLEVKMDAQNTRIGTVADRVLVIEEGRKFEGAARAEALHKAEKRSTLMSSAVAVGVTACFKLFELFGTTK